MKKTKIILLAAAVLAALCAVTAGWFRVFWDTLSVTKERPLPSSAETVYYAPLEPEEPEETASPTEPPETVPEQTETQPETEPEISRNRYESVPNYYETDYPELRFGSGSFADYGSGVTSAAMVATYLTGYDYTPDLLVRWFSNYVGNQLQILEYISDQLQLPWKRAENFHVALQALREGKVVIALMGKDSVFTSGQHFIVLTGINEAGKITVNDPNRNNYNLWNLQKSFAEGFREGDILCGYSGAWIYDPAAVPEEPLYYQNPDPEVACRYPNLTLSQQAIAEVVLNRVAADNFPNTLQGVLYAPDQFKAVSQLYAAKPTHIQYEAVRRALEGPYVLPEDVTFFATYAVNDNVWGTIGSHTFCHQW